MKAGFEGPFNEPLCIKFAAQLIEMVAGVKANRESALNTVEQGQTRGYSVFHSYRWDKRIF